MKFYHSTTSQNAKSIVGSQRIYPSEFNFADYLKELFKNGWFDKEVCGEQEYKIPSTYKDQHGNEHYVYWLGKGVYCFVETDLQQAREYNIRNDVIIEINVDKTKCTFSNIFNMDSKTNRKLLKEFILEDLIQLEKIQKTPKDKEYVQKFRRALKASMENNFKGTPHAAGILIDLFLEVHQKYKIVKCTFMHGGGKKNRDLWYTNYVSIKDTNIIKSLNKI